MGWTNAGFFSVWQRLERAFKRLGPKKGLMVNHKLKNKALVRFDQVNQASYLVACSVNWVRIFVPSGLNFCFHSVSSDSLMKASEHPWPLAPGLGKLQIPLFQTSFSPCFHGHTLGYIANFFGKFCHAWPEVNGTWGFVGWLCRTWPAARRGPGSLGSQWWWKHGEDMGKWSF